jgi:hypothetical protein
MLTQPVHIAMSTHDETLSCIKALLADHADEPFGVLRESGVQAELRGHLLRAFPERVSARLDQPHAPGRFAWQEPVLTKRVQLEMKVCYPADAPADLRSDLVVLRHEGRDIHLTCHGNGPGDVVAALRYDDVEVAVEIKASPSRTTGERIKYAKDLHRLLVLNENCNITGFFLLLDKSHARFGTVAPRRFRLTTVDMDDWRAMGEIFGGRVKFTTTPPPASAKANATICYLCPDGRPHHVFAYHEEPNFEQSAIS